MLKIKVLSPFRYEYQNKVLWLTTGEFYHLDPKQDKEEIKYLLSDMFVYKEYIYIEKSELDQSLIKEVVSKQGGSPALMQDEVAPFVNNSPPEEVLTAPTQEPEPNPFVDAASQVTFTEEAEPAEPSTGEPAPATAAEEEAVAVKENQVAEEELPADNSEERAARKSHLQSMHWSKIKDVAEQHNLQYTEKAETIEAILSIEYP